MSYQIILPQFEGPFDLLLFFIERDELDIYDIPINTITNDFLSYINKLESLNIDIASEFILVASTLMRIKAKMLLPRKEIDEEGNEIDPREELVNRLLEYKRFKSVIIDLQELEANRQLKNTRGNLKKEIRSLSQIGSSEAELESVTLYKLMTVFDRVLNRYKNKNLKVEHTIIQYNYTIRDTKTSLKTFIAKKGRSSFEEIFDTCENKIHAVFTFLAILELVQLEDLALQVGEGYNNFWLDAA